MQHQQPNFNPLIMPEEPEALKAYREQNEQRSKEIQEFQRLCWEVFIGNPSGKRLYELLVEKYLIPAKFSPTDPNADRLAMYWEGFKAAIRGLNDNAVAHTTKEA